MKIFETEVLTGDKVCKKFHTNQPTSNSDMCPLYVRDTYLNAYVYLVRETLFYT